jgi:hypothetical protein
MEQILHLVGGIDAIVAMALPAVLALIMQRSWSWQFKANVAWVVCLIVSVGIAAAQGLLVGLDWASAAAIGTKFGVILTIASQSYDKFWKPTQIAPRIEAATDLESEPFKNSALAAPLSSTPAPKEDAPLPSIEAMLRDAVRKELAEKEKPAPTVLLAGAPVAINADFSDVDSTGVTFEAEEPPVLGTIAGGVVLPSEEN